MKEESQKEVVLESETEQNDDEVDFVTAFERGPLGIKLKPVMTAAPTVSCDAENGKSEWRRVVRRTQSQR